MVFVPLRSFLPVLNSYQEPGVGPDSILQFCTAHQGLEALPGFQGDDVSLVAAHGSRGRRKPDSVSREVSSPGSAFPRLCRGASQEVGQGAPSRQVCRPYLREPGPAGLRPDSVEVAPGVRGPQGGEMSGGSCPPDSWAHLQEAEQPRRHCRAIYIFT